MMLDNHQHLSYKLNHRGLRAPRIPAANRKRSTPEVGRFELVEPMRCA